MIRTNRKCECSVRDAAMRKRGRFIRRKKRPQDESSKSATAVSTPLYQNAQTYIFEDHTGTRTSVTMTIPVTIQEGEHSFIAKVTKLTF